LRLISALDAPQRRRTPADNTLSRKSKQEDLEASEQQEEVKKNEKQRRHI
jgi:hypothetical protein